MKDYLISVGLCRLPKGKLWSVCPFPAAWVGEDWRGRFRVFHFIFWRLIMWIAHLPCFLSASSSHLPYHTELIAWDCWEMKCNVQCWCNIWAPNMKPYILIFFIKISFSLDQIKVLGPRYWPVVFHRDKNWDKIKWVSWLYAFFLYSNKHIDWRNRHHQCHCVIVLIFRHLLCITKWTLSQLAYKPISWWIVNDAISLAFHFILQFLESLSSYSYLLFCGLLLLLQHQYHEETLW